MTKPTRRHDRLLADAFHDNWEAGAAAEFARAAAAHARRRRRMRQAAASVGVAALAALGVFVARERFASAPAPTVAQAQRPAVAPAAARGYDIISDDELLAQLRDRPVLAVRKPNGARELVVLATDAAEAESDAPAKSEALE